MEAWEVGNLGQYAINSAIVTIVSVTLILLFGAGAAFALSRYRFSGRGLVAEPVRAGTDPAAPVVLHRPVEHVHAMGITDTRLALILPYAAMGLSLAVYLLKVYLDALPEELFEAARIDGASDRQLFGSLALPLLRPGLATVAIFSALAAWNEFLLALLYIQDDSSRRSPPACLPSRPAT